MFEDWHRCSCTQITIYQKYRSLNPISKDLSLSSSVSRCSVGGTQLWEIHLSFMISLIKFFVRKAEYEYIYNVTAGSRLNHDRN